MTRSALHDESGICYRLYDAADVPTEAVETLADASLQGWEVHALPLVPPGQSSMTDDELAALPRDIAFFPPGQGTSAEQLVGARLMVADMIRLGIQILVAPDAQSGTGDSWILLRNRVEANQLMARAAAAVDRKRPGAGRLVKPHPKS